MMSSNGTETAVVAIPPKKTKIKKLRPARKQVKPGDVEKKETPQTGKEYSQFVALLFETVQRFDIFIPRHLVQQMGWW